VQSQLVRPTKLVHTGFAFPVAPLGGGNPQEAATASDDFVSIAWNAAFDYLDKNSDPLVIAPAGNEAVFDAYYPAALDATYPTGGKFRNVKGVASMKPPGHNPSKFTNRGSWVACAAYGEGVQSTFIPVGPIVCEDDMKYLDPLPTVGSPPPPGIRPQDFRNSFAAWQGTSFAAPKVTGAVAAGMAQGMSPQAAYMAVVRNAQSRDPNLGYLLTHI
jgi:subtilisin family serine protease